MITERLIWKVLFFIILAVTIYSIFIAISLEEIVQPAHPWQFSILITVIDLLMLISSFNYAFKARYIPFPLFWKGLLVIYFACNAIIMYYEFTIPFGYTTEEMLIVGHLTLISLIVFSLPTYFYYKEDLAIHLP